MTQQLDFPVTLPYPNQCPLCTDRLVIQPPHLLCMNQNCAGKLIGRLKSMGGRSKLDINGLGQSICEALVLNGRVVNLSDIFQLSESALASTPYGKSSFGHTRAKTLYNNIQKAKNKPWTTVLHSLGCPGLGEPEAEKIAMRYSLDDLVAKMHPVALKGELLKIEGVGPETANTFVDWLRLNCTWLYDIVENDWLQTVYVQPEDKMTQTLVGVSVILTGKFSTPKARGEYEKRLKALGAKVPGKVSKSTTMLVVGADPGADKTEAAKKFNIPTYDEDYLIQYLEENEA